MGIDFQRSISYEEAVLHWYDAVYSPVVEIIRKQGTLRWFPDRTETDLYLWIAEHRSDLEEEFGFPVRAETIFEHLIESHSENWISRVGGKLLNLVIPDGLEGGPPTGRWRDQVEIRRDNRLFIELLVPINGKEDGWCALEQALEVAKREQAILHGLHVVPSDLEDAAGLSELQDRFDGLCRAKNIQGSLVITKGEVVEQTSIRAAATDLVVVNLSYPPGERPITRLNSGFRNLLHRSPRPVLATPQTVSQLNHGLLAFDGSAQAHEALFVATYLARQWSICLDVVSVEDGKGSGEANLEQARIYLEDHHVSARYFLETGDPGEALLLLASAEACDLIIMGSYSLKPVLEVVLGSTVDKILRGSKTPTLICR